MSTLRKQSRTRGFIQALLLALLLNLSGHTFLHLTDATAEPGAAHFTTPEEPRGLSPLPHHCSVCQDHQQLTLEVPSTATLLVAAHLSLAKQRTEQVTIVPTRQLVSDRAPPRG